MLTALRYQVLTADDGVDAIEKVQAHATMLDVILMDQSMPRKDGITATKDIRKMERLGTLTRRIPIIAVTAVASADAQARFTDAGADDFLIKPLSLDRLGKTLEIYSPTKDTRSETMAD